MRMDPVLVVAYDPRWPGAFAAQRDRIEPVLRPWLTRGVEHIGSTAVPGLPAKPIIDMLAVVEIYAQTAATVRALARLAHLASVPRPPP